MANVLNKNTKVYLTSVNTPDFDEDEWLINPDLSAVANVPWHYWQIEKVPVLTGTDPDTLEPVYGTEWLVREMTADEKAAYDATVPAAISNKLNDGTPAYQYKGFTISVSTVTLPFAVKTAGAKKFVVPFVGTGAEYISDRNRLITSVSVVAGCAGAFDIVARVNSVEKGRWTFDADQLRAADLALPVLTGQSLSFMIDSQTEVSNPAILVDTAYTN